MRLAQARSQNQAPNNHGIRLPAAWQILAIVATIFGSFLVRLSGAATGVMLGLLLSNLHRAGAGQSSAMAVGLLMGAFYLSELLGAPIIGFLVDRKGARLFLLAGPLLGLAAEVLFAGPFRFPGLILARALQGLTTACTVPAALAFLSEITLNREGEREREREQANGHRGQIMGWFEVGSIGGLAAGNMAGGFLWDGLHRMGFWPLAAIYALAAAIFVIIRADSRKAGTDARPASLAGLRQAIDLVPCWLAMNAAAGLWFGHAAYQFSGANPRLNQLLTSGFSGTTIGMIFGGYALLFAAGTILWGALLARVAIPRAMRVGTIGLLLSAAALAGINHGSSFSGGLFWFWMVLGVFGVAGATAFTPAALTLLAARSDRVREGRGAVMGVYSMLLGGGQLLGVILGGAVATAYGVDGMILATATLGIIGLASIPHGEAPRALPLLTERGTSSS